MWFARVALIQMTTPVSTSATWINVGILGFQAPPSIQITSAMRQAPSVSVTITVMTIRHSERQDSTWALQRLMHDQWEFIDEIMLLLFITVCLPHLFKILIYFSFQRQYLSRFALVLWVKSFSCFTPKIKIILSFDHPILIIFHD